MKFSIKGTGSYVPEHILTNDALANMVDTNDEWITMRTGIKTRHICTHESLLDLAKAACDSALQDAKIKADELDLIICSTMAGDYITPSLACTLQRAIGANCPAFDVNAACSGFLYSLEIASMYFQSGAVKKVLVVAAEAMSRMLDWTDRTTCVLFGDGAGAVVLGEGEGLLAIQTSALGDVDILHIPNVDGETPFAEKKGQKPHLHMMGQSVFKFAVPALYEGIKTTMEKAGCEAHDINYILSHQANMRIISAALQKLNIDEKKIVTNLEKYGNTSSASIPLLLDELSRSGRLSNGDLLIMCAFGGGLTTGSALIRWDK